VASGPASHGGFEKTADSSRKEVSVTSSQVFNISGEKPHKQGKRTFLANSTVYVL
jgi:hypothetical protein